MAARRRKACKQPQSEIDSSWNEVGRHYGYEVQSQEEAARILPIETIVELAKATNNEEVRAINGRLWDMDVASDAEILVDAEELMKSDKLYLVQPPFSQYLSVRAIPGHAQSGHATFKKLGRETIRYPNTDIDTVLNALEGSRINGMGEISKEKFKNDSQRTIDDIVHFVENYFKPILKYPSRQIPNPKRKAIKKDGNPIGGLEFLEHQEIDTLEFMRGFYFASLMDNYEKIRTRVSELYGHNPGGGSTFLMNKLQLMGYGIGLRDLSEKRFSGLLGILNDMDRDRKIELLSQIGVVEKHANHHKSIDPMKQNWTILKQERGVDLLENRHLTNQYIRYKTGLGCADDIAIFLASFLPNTYSSQARNNAEISRFLGALMADKIDTLEKDARFVFPGGQDEFVGEYFNTLFQTVCRVNKKFRDKFEITRRKDEQYELLPQRTIVDYMAASANLRDETIHSSQRWFYKDIMGTCALSQYTKQMFSMVRRAGKETPSDAELKQIYKINMTKRTPLVNLTFKQIPARDIINTMMRRYELIYDPSQRERKLIEFYSERGN